MINIPGLALGRGGATIKKVVVYGTQEGVDREDKEVYEDQFP